jgi:sensor histidine kinase regulating citrate/malate metabolism
MEEEIHQFEDLNRTGNPVLDTIVTSKSILCHKEGITLHCVADGKTLDFMDPMDLSALFGNILDNSMEAVRKIPDPEQRLIRLAVSRKKGFVRIVAENRYDGEIVFRQGLPLTSKQDPGYHGYGVSSIKNTVEKYGGSTRIQTREGWFCLNILIPAGEKA